MTLKSVLIQILLQVETVERLPTVMISRPQLLLRQVKELQFDLCPLPHLKLGQIPVKGGKLVKWCKLLGTYSEIMLNNAIIEL